MQSEAYMTALTPVRAQVHAINLNRNCSLTLLHTAALKARVPTCAGG
jgi:hypothetical protein